MLDCTSIAKLLGICFVPRGIRALSKKTHRHRAKTVYMGLRRRRQSYDSRTFVDRIHIKTNQYANWEPAFPIELGDYGHVDRDTGIFGPVGNIFQDENMRESTAELRTVTGTEEKSHVIVSGDATEVAFDDSLSKAAMDKQFQFTNDYGAVLLMHRPTTSKIVGELDSVLRADQYRQLKDMHVVTEVVKCPAYALYLSGRKCETVKIALCENRSIPAVLRANAGGDANRSWNHEGTSGVFRCGSQPNAAYTTLYNTVSIGASGEAAGELESPGQETSNEDTWMVSKLPWNTLDEDGEEEPDDPIINDGTSDEKD